MGKIWYTLCEGLETKIMLIYLFLFLIGMLEEAVAIIYYGFIRRNWRLPCAFMSMARNWIWIFAGAGIFGSFLNFESIVANGTEFLIRGSIHTAGVGVGNYLSLYYEKGLHEKILKLQKKK